MKSEEVERGGAYDFHLQKEGETTSEPKGRQFVRLMALVAVLSLVWLLLHGELYASALYSLLPASTAFTVFTVVSFASSGFFMVGFIFFIVKVERVKDVRSFFKIRTLDVKGLLLILVIGVLFQLFNAVFLYKALLEPARNLLLSIGLFGGKIGLGAQEIVPSLSTYQAVFLTAFVLVFWWIEVPEELFFRGYVQNKLQGIVGKNVAVFLSALLWDFAHLFGLVSVLERFFYGLIYAFIFRIRQNTTPTMIFHPVGNRALLLSAVMPQIWGTTLDVTTTNLLALVIMIVLILTIIAGWKILNLNMR